MRPLSPEQQEARRRFRANRLDVQGLNAALRKVALQRVKEGLSAAAERRCEFYENDCELKRLAAMMKHPIQFWGTTTGRLSEQPIGTAPHPTEFFAERRKRQLENDSDSGHLGADFSPRGFLKTL